MNKRIIMHTDGGARGNPGPAGAGAVAFDDSGRTLKEGAFPLGRATNNYAEYAAVAFGLEMLAKYFGKPQCKQLDVVVRMDSELVCKQLRGEYQVKEETLYPLYMRVHNLLVSTFPHVAFEHVPREANKHADRLANEAMDRVSA